MNSTVLWYHLHVMFLLLDRDWGVEADPPDKNFQSPVWGSSSTSGGVKPPPNLPDKSNTVCTPSIARWKARGRLPIRRNWTFFAISYGWEVVSGNLSKSAFFEWGGSLWAQISDERGRRLQTTVGVKKLEWSPFRMISTYPQCIVWFCHKARVWQTDRRRDRVTTPKTALA